MALKWTRNPEGRWVAQEGWEIVPKTVRSKSGYARYVVGYSLRHEGVEVTPAASLKTAKLWADEAYAQLKGGR